MEDSHIANLDIGDGISIFGVFDGHGGKNKYSLIVLKVARSLCLYRNIS